MKTLTINVDIDGVLGDFHGEILPRIYARGGFVGGTNQMVSKEAWTNWNPWVCFTITKAVWGEIFREAVQAKIFRYEPPIPGAIEGVTELIEQGHRVRIVTSKILWDMDTTIRAEIDTLEWLYLYRLIEHVEVVFTGTTHHKTEFVADVVIDDHPHIETWCQPHPVLNLMYDQPWNRVTRFDGDLSTQPFYVRALDWDDIVWAINQFANTA